MILKSDWYDEALCEGRDDLTWFYAVKSDLPKLDESVKLCRECPVIEQCGKYAIDDDAVHSIRGGELPGVAIYLRRQEGGDVPVDDRPTLLKRGVCANDHPIKSLDDLYIRKVGASCRECDREARRGLNVTKARTHCNNGHPRTPDNIKRYVKPNGNKDSYCIPCNKARNKRRGEREKMKRAMMAS